MEKEFVESNMDSRFWRVNVLRKDFKQALDDEYHKVAVDPKTRVVSWEKDKLPVSTCFF